MSPIEKTLAPRQAGKCKFWNRAAGFGFVIGNDGIERFFNSNHVSNGQTLAAGVAVSFVARQNQRGPIADRIQAE